MGNKKKKEFFYFRFKQKILFIEFTECLRYGSAHHYHKTGPFPSGNRSLGGWWAKGFGGEVLKMLL